MLVGPGTCCTISRIANNRVVSDDEAVVKVGRPQILVSGEQIECLRNMGFTWDVISTMLCL